MASREQTLTSALAFQYQNYCWRNLEESVVAAAFASEDHQLEWYVEVSSCDAVDVNFGVPMPRRSGIEAALMDDESMIFLELAVSASLGLRSPLPTASAVPRPRACNLREVWPSPSRSTAECLLDMLGRQRAQSNGHQQILFARDRTSPHPGRVVERLELRAFLAEAVVL